MNFDITLKPLVVKSKNIASFFSEKINKYSFFLLDWYNGLTIQFIGNESIFNSINANNQTQIKVEYLYKEQIVQTDNFKPKNNLKYSLYAQKNNERFLCFLNGAELTYKNVKAAALQLTKQDYKVIIAENYVKSKVLVPQHEPEIQPFNLKRSDRNIFYYHSRTNTFSNLLNKETSDKIGLDSLDNWFSIGYSTIFICQRVTYYLANHTKEFAKKEKGNYIVFSKEDMVSTFKNYNDAISYCDKKSRNKKLNFEFLIAREIRSIQWH